MQRIWLRKKNVEILSCLLSCMAIPCLPLTVNAESEAQKVCQAVSGNIQKICDTGITYPTSASVKMCREEQTVFEPLSCKTKKSVSYDCPEVLPCKTKKCTSVRYPCGMDCNWRGCKTKFCEDEHCVCVPGTRAKTCSREVCVPGTREKKIIVDVPCGANLGTEKITICDERISPKIQDTLRVAGVGCSCMDSISKFMDDGLDKVMNSGEVNQATSEALKAFAKMSQCVTDQGFSVKDNKDEATKILSDNDKFFILAPEIGTSFYIDFVTRCVACAYGNCDTLINLFTDYLQETKDKIIFQLKNFDDKLNGRVVELKSIVEQIIERVRTISSEFKQNTVDCTAPEANDVLAALSSLETIAGFGDRVSDLNSALIKIEKLLNQLEQVSSALDNINTSGYKEQLLKSIANGKLPNLTDSLDFIKNIDELREMGAGFSDLEMELPRVLQVLTDAEKAISKIKSIASAPQVLNQCLSSQAEVKFNNDVNELNDKIAKGKEIIDGFKISKIDINAGVITYQRWSDVSFDVPCSKQGKKCLQAGGFEECLEYPMLYSCRYEKRIPFPNHHIPYLKIKLN